MKAHILHTIDNHVYYTQAEDPTKTIFKMEVTRNMLIAVDDMFIGGGAGAATTSQKKAVAEFFHRTQGIEVSKLDLLTIAQMADPATPKRRTRTVQPSKMLEEKGYSFV